MDYALSLRPEYHQAILDIIAHYNWKSIIYIYDSHDGSYRSLFRRVSHPIFIAVLVLVVVVVAAWLVGRLL